MGGDCGLPGPRRDHGHSLGARVARAPPAGRAPRCGLRLSRRDRALARESDPGQRRRTGLGCARRKCPGAAAHASGNRTANFPPPVHDHRFRHRARGVAGGWGWRAYSGAALPEVARVELRSQVIVAFDAADRELWTVPFDQPLLKRPWPPAIVVSDVDGDGRREVVASVEVEHSPGFGRGELLLLRGDGTVRWRRCWRTRSFSVRPGSAPWQEVHHQYAATGSYPWAHNTPSWPGIVAVHPTDEETASSSLGGHRRSSSEPQRPLLAAPASDSRCGRHVRARRAGRPGPLGRAPGIGVRVPLLPASHRSLLVFAGSVGASTIPPLTSVTTRGAGLVLLTQENFVLEYGSSQQIFTFD